MLIFFTFFIIVIISLFFILIFYYLILIFHFLILILNNLHLLFDRLFFNNVWSFVCVIFVIIRVLCFIVLVFGFFRLVSLLSIGWILNIFVLGLRSIFGRFCISCLRFVSICCLYSLCYVLENFVYLMVILSYLTLYSTLLQYSSATASKKHSYFSIFYSPLLNLHYSRFSSSLFKEVMYLLVSLIIFSSLLDYLLS